MALNKADAPNAAITPRFPSGHDRCGVGDLRRLAGMSILHHLALLSSAVTLAGCQTRLAGDYHDPPIAKNPTRLHLNGDGWYSFGATYLTDGLVERGRWWRLQEGVVMLVPDDTAKTQWFARVARKDPLRQLRHSTDVRDVLKEPAP